MQRLLHKLRVIVFLDIFVLHDMDKRTCTTVFPGTSQFVNQPFRRIEAVAFIALLRPTFEDQARFGMTGGGIGVVFVDFQATFIHAEIHTTSDHMVTATLPGETQTWPEDFRNVKQRQQVVIFQHLVGGVKIHQVQLVGGFNQLLLGTLGNGVVMIRILIDHLTVGLHIGVLQRIFFIQPFTVKLAFVFQTRPADFQQFACNFRLWQAVFGIFRLDHPAQNSGVIEGVFQGIAAVFDHHLQLACPLLPLRQRGMNHVLFRNTDFVAMQLGNDGDMASVFKFTAFIPDKKRTRDRRTRRAVRKCLQWQDVVINHFTQEAQRENLPRHTHVSEDHTVIQKEKTASKFNALPFVAHIFVVDIATEYGVIFVFLRIERTVI